MGVVGNHNGFQRMEIMNIIGLSNRLSKKGLAFSAGTLLLIGAICIYWFKFSSTFNFLIVMGLLLPIGAVVSYAHGAGWLSRPQFAMKMYVVVLTLFSAIFVFAIPPFASPDEGHHFFSSYWLCDVLMGDATFDDGADFPVRSDVVDMYRRSNIAIGSSGFRAVTDSFELLSDTTDIVRVSDFNLSFGSENVAAKIPSIFGIALARMLGLGSYPLFYLGRILSALFFVASAVISVRMAPIAKAVFAGVSLLPMTLQLAGSYSYDCGIIALGFLFTSVLLRAVLSDRPMGVVECALLLVLSAVLAPLKIVYMSALILILFIPQCRFASRRHSLCFKSVAFLLAISSIVAVRIASVASLVGASGGGALDYRGLESGTFYSVSDFIADPLGTAALYFRSFDALADFYLESMLGSLPGWLQENLRTPDFIMYGYLVCILLVAQKTPSDDRDIPNGIRIAIIAAFAITVLGIMTSMALGWTFNTEYIIDGVQGRYFLPLLPMVLVAARSNDIAVKKSPMDICLLVVVMLNIVYILRFAALAFSLP